MSKPQGTLKVETTLDKAVAAAKTDLAPGLTLGVNGTSYTIPELISKLESYVPYFSGARQKRVELFALLSERDDLLPEVISFLDSLRGVLVGLFGPTSPELEKFGFALRKQRVPMTAEQLLARATKAKATRTLRHTMGSKQKAAIKATGTPIIKATMVDTTAAPAKTTFTSTLPIVSSPPAPPSAPASPSSAASSA